MAQPTKIKTQSGQLYTTSQEDLQKLTKDAGLPAAPITPVGASALGANPDSTKMTGSSAQKTASLRESIQAGNSLAEAMNKPQAPQAQTAQSKQTVQASQNLAGLTSFSDRVGQIAQAKADEAVKKQVAFDPTKASNNQPLATALTKLNANPADSQALVEAAKALGMSAEDVSSGKLFEALKGQFGSQVTTAAPTVNLSMFSAGDWKALGFAGANDFATKLGLNPASIGSMTPDQAKQAIESFRQTKLGRADSLRALLSDPFASPADKENARAELANMGQQGTLSAESQATQTVSSLRQAIKDPTINTEAGNQAIQAQQDKAKAEADKFAQTQQARAQQSDLGQGGRLNDSVMKLLDPTWGQVSSSTSQINSPLYQDLKAGRLPSDQIGKIVAFLNVLPEGLRNKRMAELSGLGAAKLASYLGDNPALFQKKLEQQDFIKSLPLDKNAISGDQLAQTLGFNSETDLVKAIKDARIMQKSGLFGSMDSGLAELSKVVQLDLTGKVDKVATAKALKKATGTSLDSAAASQDLTTLPGKLGAYGESAEDKTAVDTRVKNSLDSIKSDILSPAPSANLIDNSLLPSSNYAPGTKSWDAIAKNKDKILNDITNAEKEHNNWEAKVKAELAKVKGTPAEGPFMEAYKKQRADILAGIKEKKEFMKAQQYIFDTTAQVYTAMGGNIGTPGTERYRLYKRNLAAKLRENPDTFSTVEKTIKDFLAKYTDNKNWTATSAPADRRGFTSMS